MVLALSFRLFAQAKPHEAETGGGAVKTESPRDAASPADVTDAISVDGFSKSLCAELPLPLNNGALLAVFLLLA